jgi:hypothetical protein
MGLGVCSRDHSFTTLTATTRRRRKANRRFICAFGFQLPAGHPGIALAFM